MVIPHPLLFNNWQQGSLNLRERWGRKTTTFHSVLQMNLCKGTFRILVEWILWSTFLFMVSKAHCVNLVPDRDQHSKPVPLFLNNVLLFLGIAQLPRDCFNAGDRTGLFLKSLWALNFYSGPIRFKYLKALQLIFALKHKITA